MAEKFMDKVKFFMGIDSYEEDAVESEIKVEMDEPIKPQISTPSYFTNTQPATPNKVVNIHKTNQMKVVLYQPKEFNDTRAVVDALKNRRPVILNIEDLDAELARKVFDFCSGALYALDGHIQKISRGIFILAPNNVDVSGDVKTELEEKGIYPWNK